MKRYPILKLREGDVIYWLSQLNEKGEVEGPSFTVSLGKKPGELSFEQNAGGKPVLRVADYGLPEHVILAARAPRKVRDLEKSERFKVMNDLANRNLLYQYLGANDQGLHCGVADGPDGKAVPIGLMPDTYVLPQP
jgi:hypothetical protein